MSFNERSHYVTVADSNEDVRSSIYDPNGNAMTYGDVAAMLNQLQDDCQTLRDVLANICDCRNPFEGPSLDYMQGYRDGQHYLQRLARLGLSAVTGGGE